MIYEKVWKTNFIDVSVFPITRFSHIRSNLPTDKIAIFQDRPTHSPRNKIANISSRTLSWKNRWNANMNGMTYYSARCVIAYKAGNRQFRGKKVYLYRPTWNSKLLSLGWQHAIISTTSNTYISIRSLTWKKDCNENKNVMTLLIARLYKKAVKYKALTQTKLL